MAIFYEIESGIAEQRYKDEKAYRFWHEYMPQLVEQLNQITPTTPVTPTGISPFMWQASLHFPNEYQLLRPLGIVKHQSLLKEALEYPSYDTRVVSASQWSYLLNQGYPGSSEGHLFEC